MVRPTLITVEGTYVKPDGTPEYGTVYFRSKTSALSSADETVMVPGVVKANLGLDGSLSIQVPATNDPAWSPVGWTYEVHARLSEGISTFNVMIPYDVAGGVLSLSSLVPVGPAGGNLYAPYNHTHEHDSGSSGNPATTVVSETSYGQASAVGVSTNFARADHSHGTPAAITLSSLGAAPTASPTFTGTVSGISKSMVGLGSVDNTADASKPVSSAQQTALNGKANTSHTHVISSVTGLQAELDDKQPVGSYALSSEVTALTSRVVDVEDATPVVMSWNGTAYVETAAARIYVGPNDPGSVPDGSVWIDTTP